MKEFIDYVDNINDKEELREYIHSQRFAIYLIKHKGQLNEDFEQEVIAFLNYKEGGIIYVGIRKNGQVVGLKDVDLIENIGSGVLRILDAYDKGCFKFMDHFLRVSFKYKENPFEYDDTAKVESSKLGSKKSSK